MGFHYVRDTLHERGRAIERVHGVQCRAKDAQKCPVLKRLCEMDGQGYVSIGASNGKRMLVPLDRPVDDSGVRLSIESLTNDTVWQSRRVARCGAVTRAAPAPYASVSSRSCQRGCCCCRITTTIQSTFSLRTKRVTLFPHCRMWCACF